MWWSKHPVRTAIGWIVAIAAVAAPAALLMRAHLDSSDGAPLGYDPDAVTTSASAPEATATPTEYRQPCEANPTSPKPIWACTLIGGKVVEVSIRDVYAADEDVVYVDGSPMVGIDGSSSEFTYLTGGANGQSCEILVEGLDRWNAGDATPPTASVSCTG